MSAKAGKLSDSHNSLPKLGEKKRKKDVAQCSEKETRLGSYSSFTPCKCGNDVSCRLP